MGLEISYTCNWCTLKVVMPAVKTPEEWIEEPVHNPETMKDEMGYFCKALCRDTYQAAEPGAIETAQTNYKTAFWKALNDAKAQAK